MIHRIYSSLPTFKSIEFKPGLNVLLAQKTEGASSKQTRNRAGKSSLIETIHFLTGGKVDERTPFSSKALENVLFGMEFDVAHQQTTVERENRKRAKVKVDNSAVSGEDWRARLGAAMFGLSEDEADDGKSPSFRALFAYFVRRQASLAFSAPEKSTAIAPTGEYQMAVMFLLGLDWRIAREWQFVRDREKSLEELKKAAEDGVLGKIIGKSADLRTQLTIAEANLRGLQNQISQFRVLPQYADLEAEASGLTRKLNDLVNENTIDLSTIRDLELALASEAAPSLPNLEALYNQAGVVLPGAVLRRYEDVHSFHESVVRNRRDYLSSELEAAASRIETRNQQKIRLDARRAELMGILRSHGALEQFSKLQSEMNRVESEVQSLRQRFETAEKLEGTKNELEIERNRLLLRLRRDFSEQREQVSKAILAYEQTSNQLYESAGRMLIEETLNGPVFKFPMHGSRSKGIKNMQIYCFDMMLMRLCAERGIGPGFLVHDSHLFDGVDGRQLISALKVGADIASELGFQYIVTLNQDDAFKEVHPEFDLNDHVLPIRLTDATEDGGLFGIRFD